MYSICINDRAIVGVSEKINSGGSCPLDKLQPPPPTGLQVYFLLFLFFFNLLFFFHSYFEYVFLSVYLYRYGYAQQNGSHA